MFLTAIMENQRVPVHFYRQLTPIDVHTYNFH